MKTPAYTLRPATEDDYDFLYDLHCRTLRDAVAATWGWDEAFQRAYFRDRWEPAARQVIVVDGQDVGELIYERDEEEDFLARILIAPASQNQGLGTTIIRDLLADARRRGRALGLHVLKANPAALRLYRRLGFAIVEEREERYVMRATPGS